MAQVEKRGYRHGPPYDSGFLEVGSIHQIHYEQYGKKDGRPVVFIHGGPGGSAIQKNTVYFNPAIYRVVLFDQRGCGQSLPPGDIRENTTPHLVSDIDALRKHLGIDRWHVFGASWGTALALCYAQEHPEAVVSLTLRGLAIKTREDPDINGVWERTRVFDPEVYDEVIGHLTESEREDITDSFFKRFTCGDRATELAAAKVYDRWGGRLSRLVPDEDEGDAPMTEAEEEKLLATVRIDGHYNSHGGWLTEMNFLEPEQVEKIKHIPCAIVNGRYDLLCPPKGAWRVHKLMTSSRIFFIQDAGHSAAEPGIHDKLIDICDEFASLPV